MALQQYSPVSASEDDEIVKVPELASILVSEVPITCGYFSKYNDRILTIEQWHSLKLLETLTSTPSFVHENDGGGAPSAGHFKVIEFPEITLMFLGMSKIFGFSSLT